MTKNQARKQVAQFMNRLYQKSLTTTGGGNVSVRLHDKIYITPSQTDKGNMNSKQVGIITLDGQNLTPNIQLSMESTMHLAIYKKRSDIAAIVHAHPFTATALSSKPNLINTKINGEAWSALGEPKFVPYKMMGTKELAESAAECSVKSNVLILQNHGILVLGKTLLEAFDKLEVTEMTARMNFVQRLFDCENPIDSTGIDNIDKTYK